MSEQNLNELTVIELRKLADFLTIKYFSSR